MLAARADARAAASKSAARRDDGKSCERRIDVERHEMTGLPPTPRWPADALFSLHTCRRRSSAE